MLHHWLGSSGGVGRAGEVHQGSSQGGKVPTDLSVEPDHPQEPHKYLPGGKEREGQYGLCIGLFGTNYAVPFHMSQIDHQRLSEGGLGQVDGEPGIV